MRKSRLSKTKQNRLIEHFVAGTTSRTASVLVGVNKNTAAYYFQRLRGAAGKIPVFGLLKRGGKVYTKIIPDVKAATLMPIMKRRIQPNSVVYTDCLASYNVLDVSCFKHYRINHSELFADRKNHITGIEIFWNQAKRHLRKFNGVPKSHFHLYLKECEWRFNNSKTEDRLKLLKQLVKNNLS